MYKRFVTALIIIILAAVNTNAAEVILSGEDIILSGTVEKANSNVNLVVTDTDGRPLWFDSQTSDGSGTYSFIITFKMSSDKTEYFAYINAEKTARISTLSIEDVVDKINNASEDEILELVEDYADFLGLNLSVFYNKLKDKSVVGNLMANANLQSIEKLRNRFSTAVAIGAIKEANKANLIERLKLLANDLSIPSSSSLYRFDETEERKFITYFLTATFKDTDDFLSEFKYALEYAQKKNEGSSGDVSRNFTYNGTENDKTPNEPTVPKTEYFNDLDSVLWAKDSISRLKEKGIINGKENGIFAPNDLVTREEFVKMITAAFGISEQGEHSFSDVSKDSWYYDAVAAGVGTGIIKGISNELFGVGQAVTRQDCAVISYRAAQYCKIDLTGDYTEEFDDMDYISDYAKIAVKTMQGIKVINGVGDNRFDPKGFCTRAMAAKIIDMLLER